MTRSPISAGLQLERLAGELQDLAVDFEKPSRSTNRADAPIARVEDMAARIRAVVRNPSAMR